MPAAIFSGNDVKLLKANLNLSDNQKILTGSSDDPTSVAKDAPIGSLYIKSDDGNIFQKLDSGSSTEWSRIHNSRTTDRSAGTSWLEGGVLSINGGDSAKFDITAGSGVIVDSYTDPTVPVSTNVSWGSQTAVTLTNIGTELFTVIAMDSSGNIVEFNTPSDNDRRKDFIVLGSFIHLDMATISVALNIPVFALDSYHQLTGLADALGALNVSGNIISANGANLNMNRSAGEVFEMRSNTGVDVKNPNNSTTSSANAFTFGTFYRDGVGGRVQTGGVTEVPVTEYDDGSGSLAPIPNNKFIMHRVHYNTLSQDQFLEYGQIIYDSIAEAQAATTSEIFETTAVDPSFLGRAWLIVKKSTSDLTSATEVLFVGAGKFGFDQSGSGSNSATTTMQQAYDNGSEPEITLNSTRGALSIADNSSPIGAPLFEIHNNADTTSYLEVDANGIGGDGIGTSFALESDSNDRIKSSSVTSAELAHVSGVTSAIQTQLNTGATNLTDHEADVANPHVVTQTQVGLSNVDNTSDATKDAASATLTNKTITSAILNTAVSGTAVLDEDDLVTDSATQLATQQSIKAYVDSSVSASNINYIKNPQFESNINDTSDSGADVSSSHNAGGALRGSGTLRAVFEATATTSDYLNIDMDDIDNVDEGRTLFISFDYTTDLNYATDDLQVVLFNDDSTQEELVTGGNGSGKLVDAVGGRFNGVVYLPPTDNSYTLRIKSTTNRANTAGLTIDNIVVGPQALLDAPIVSDPIDFTPSFTNLTVGNGTFESSYYKRDGNFMYGKVHFTLGSTSSMGTSPEMTIPGGFTADTSFDDASSTVNGLGNGGILDSGTAVFSSGVFLVSSTKIRLKSQNTSAQFVNLSSTVPITWTTSDILEYDFRIPITEWANSSALFSSKELMNQTVKISGAGNGGTVLTANVTDIDFTEVSDPIGAWDGDTFIAPKTGKYTMSGFVLSTAGVSIDLSAYIDGSLAKKLGSADASTANHLFTGDIDLIKGEALTLRSSGAMTLSNVVASHHISIAEIPDFTVFGNYPEPLKTQTKFLTANHTTDTTISDLTFSNLTIGQWYEVNLQAYLHTSASDAGVALKVVHDSAVIAYAEQTSDGSAVNVTVSTTTVKFKAVATALTFLPLSATANAYVGGATSTESTFVVLSEIQPQQETSEW